MSRGEGVPAGWVEATLEDVAEVHDNLREPVNSDERAKRLGPYPYYGATGQVGWIDGYRQDGEYVLLGEDGAPFLDPTKPKAYMVSGQCWVNNHAHVLKGLGGLCRNKWLLHALNNANYRGYANGTTRLKLTQRAMRRLPIKLAPLPEQQRIVDKVEELFSDLDAGVAALERVRANLKRYRASVLKAAVEGKLTAEWRRENPPSEPASALLERILKERRKRWEEQQVAAYEAKGKKPPKGWQAKYKEGREPEVDSLPDLPKGWCWATVEQLASDLPRSIQSGPFGSNLKHSEFQDTGVLAIGIDNVLDGKFSMGREHRISESKYEELSKYEARPLDVVITVMATVGRCCVVPKDIEKSIITKHVYRITVDQTLVDPYYLQIALSGGAEVRRQIFGEVRGQTRPGINGSILKLVAIPVPSLVEQKQVVSEVQEKTSLAEAVEAEVEATMKRSGRLRQSILKRAFEGKLVPQDPKDEPASKLLERIGQAKRKTEDNGKRGKSNCRQRKTPRASP